MTEPFRPLSLLLLRLATTPPITPSYQQAFSSMSGTVFLTHNLYSIPSRSDVILSSFLRLIKLLNPVPYASDPEKWKAHVPLQYFSINPAAV